MTAERPGKTAIPCLVIFCKRPAPGHGKQRLAATIGADAAHILAAAMLNCALEDAMCWPGEVALSPASGEDMDWAANLLERDCQVIAQPQGGLGVRLRHIDRNLRSRGQDKVIFMGSDAPMLLPRHFEEARSGLGGHDIVLSPASDGGVTLMGSRTGWPDMQHLPWSTSRLGHDLAQDCRAHGLIVEMISPSYDIDVEDDLARLHRDLCGDPRSARMRLYGHLSDFLKNREKQYA